MFLYWASVDHRPKFHWIFLRSWNQSIVVNIWEAVHAFCDLHSRCQDISIWKYLIIFLLRKFFWTVLQQVLQKYMKSTHVIKCIINREIFRNKTLLQFFKEVKHANVFFWFTEKYDGNVKKCWNCFSHFRFDLLHFQNMFYSQFHLFVSHDAKMHGGEY